MKKYYFLEDSFRNRMIVSILAIVVLSVFNIWFIYKDQSQSRAATAATVFFIDNSLSVDCLVGTGNYSPAGRSCAAVETGYKAWRSPWTGLAWIKAAQTAGTIATGGHTIYFRAGTYRNYLTSAVWPSGIEGRNNKIEGYQSEEVILSGANAKTTWEDMGNGAYRTALGSANGYYEKNYRGVFEDGGALYSARYPEDYLTRLSTSSTTREFFIDCDLNNLTSEKILDSWFEVMDEHLWKKKAKIESYSTSTCAATFSTVHDTTDVVTGLSENNFLDTKTDGTYKNSAPSLVTNYRLTDNISLLDTAGEYLYQVTADANDTDYVLVLPLSGEAPAGHLWEVAGRTNVLYFYDNTHYLELRKLSVTGSGGQGIQVSAASPALSNSYLVFDDLHIYYNSASGIYVGGYSDHIVLKNSLVEDNGSIGVNYQGPYSYHGFNIVDSTYYTAHSEIYNNQFLNNVSCGSYTVYVDDLLIHDNYYEGNGLFNLNSALSIHDSSNVDVYNNHMFQNGGNGILLEGSVDMPKQQRVHHIDLYNNLIEEAAYLSPGWVTGFWSSDTDYIKFFNNVVHSPNGVALHVDSGQGNEITYNQFLDIFANLPNTTYGAVLLENADGIDPDGTWPYAINNTIAHNIFIGDFKYGLKVYTDIDVADGSNVHDNKVVNNIFYSTSNSKVIPVQLNNDVNHSLNTYNNNIYYAPNASEVKFVYQSLGNNVTSEYTFANYQTQSNQDSNSLQTNPLFTNFASNIFTLQSNSPAIDNAMLLADINNTSYQGSGPDIGLFEYASGPVCGNHLTESGEQCDDGNAINNDGCSSSCQTEQANPPPVNPTCSDNIQNGNEAGIDCGGSCSACSNGNEQGGGANPPPPESPPIVCGNNISELGEQCDDGNVLNNDGCSYLCQIETDITPTSTPTTLEIDKLQGTLVKTSLDPKVYYINTNNQRYLIPNLNTFKSWFKNFNSLTIITPQTLASFEYKGRLTVKPGRLVVFQNSNKVYVVEPEKTLRWIKTGTVFKDFGYDFKKVITLPQEDFQYYTQGEDLATSTIHPTGQLLKHGNFPPIFYIKDNIEYWIKDETTFLSLGFRWQDVITIPVRYWYTRVLDSFSFRLKER